MIGIYRIRNIINDKCYYGSSKEIKKRWSRHRRELNKNEHHNIHLQRAWNKHGKDNFSFEIIELCDAENLLTTEQSYLDTSPFYNIGKAASGGDNITNNPNRNEIIKNISNAINHQYSLMTKQERVDKYARYKSDNPNWRGGPSFKNCSCGEKIAVINKTCIKCRDNFGVKNPFYGKKHTKEAKEKQRKAMIGKKPVNMKKLKISDIQYNSLTEASNITKIPKSTILWRIRSKNKKFADYKYL